MQKIFNNKALKNSISLALPVIIGLLSSSMGSWSYSKDKTFVVKLLLLIIISIIFIFFLILSYKYDKKDVQEIEKLNKTIDSLNNDLKVKQNQIEVYEKSNSALSAIFSASSDDINTTANNIKKNSLIPLDFWNFKKVCKWICEKVLTLIEQISIDGNKLSVSIFQLTPLTTGKTRSITLIAHSSNYGYTPDVYEKPLKFKNNSDFYAVKLFKKNKHEPTILINSNEINEKFIYKDEDNHPDYSQYAAIPIYCKGNEMLSLLQIVALGNSKIGHNKSDISNIINKYIFPYVQFGLMTFKYEKCLLNSGYIVEKLKGEISK